MSYGVFNWWWDEDSSFLKRWNTLTILSIQNSSVGSYAYIDNKLNPDGNAPNVRTSSYIYDSRICSYQYDNMAINRDFGTTEWKGLVENHPDVAKQLLSQPCLIYMRGEHEQRANAQDILEVFGLTVKEFKNLFVLWEEYRWWILKSPRLTRKIGRILKSNSPNLYNKFALDSKGMIP